LSALIRPLVVTVFVSVAVSLIQRGVGDYAVLYKAAAHAFGPVYDTRFIDSFAPGAGAGAPWAYPPTFLMMILPFGLVGARLSFALWVGLTTAVYVEATALTAGRWAPAILLSPLFFVPAVYGQTTMLMGALAVSGLLLAERRPVLSGVLLGVAACIKPQLMVFAPLGLLVAGRWRVLASAAATALVLAFAATVVFGPEKWAAWLSGLTGFVDVNISRGNLQLRPSSPWVWAGLAVVGAGLVAWAFRRGDAVAQTVAAVGSALMVSPHSLFYDVGVLGPVALGMLLSRSFRIVPAVLLVAGAVRAWPFLLLIVVLSVFRPPGVVTDAFRALVDRYRLDWSGRRQGR
jgi:glycosyl transferase family 87